MSAPKNEISIEDVDQEIASGSRLLAFRPAIERSFEQDTTDERVRMFIGSGTIAIILYDIFLINDYLILNDRFYELVFARLGIFTPTIALTMVVIVKFRNAVLRECLAAVGAILGVALPMTNLVFSNSGDRLSYQFGTLLMMVFVTIIQRQRFRYAAFSITIMTSIQILRLRYHVFLYQRHSQQT